MKSLEFRLVRGFIVTALEPVDIKEEVIDKFRNHYNKKYYPFIDQINAAKGYVELTVSNDGKKIIGEQIYYPLDLSDEIHEHLSK
jgi:hypothetical protein